MKFLITGGCGFVGSNLAAEVVRRGESLVIVDNLSRTGSQMNLQWLRELGKFTFEQVDIRTAQAVSAVVAREKPDVVFHMAGQVAMSTSIQNPSLDFETNALGTVNVLEAVRNSAPEAILLYSSTNKVYGDLEQYTYDEEETRYVCREFPRGFDETVPLSFQSPYGCSKGAADQYILDYARIFSLRSAVFRHSSMYGDRQFATYDQGWVGWFCDIGRRTKQNLLNEPFTISGTGKQVRDVLFADDVTNLYFAATASIEKIRGQAFNVGGGIESSLSLLELFALLEKELKISMTYTKLPWRESDQKVFVADNTRITSLTGWTPKIGSAEGISRMLEWLSRLD